MASLSALTAPEADARIVLLDHQRLDVGTCGCGWGVDTGGWGKSYTEHVIQCLRAEGLRIVRSRR